MIIELTSNQGGFLFIGNEVLKPYGILSIDLKDINKKYLDNLLLLLESNRVTTSKEAINEITAILSTCSKDSSTGDLTQIISELDDILGKTNWDT